MSSSSFPEFDDSVPLSTESTHPFDDHHSDYTPPPYNSSVPDSFDDSAVFSNSARDDAVFGSNGAPLENGAVFAESGGPILPPPDDMQDEGFALREWRRQNAIVLEQKEKREREILSQIIEEANEYKVAFHEKRKTTCEKNIAVNREKEKLFLADHEKFHKEADKNYWKSIADLIPNEVPVIKKRGKKEVEKKPSVVVIQGPKPGKPTDRARMRQILVKLKHSTPDHLRLSPPAETATEDGTSDATPATPSTVDTIAAAPEPVIVA